MKNFEDMNTQAINLLSKRKIRIKGVSFVPLWFARIKGMMAARNSDQAIENNISKLLSSYASFMHGEKAYFEAVTAPIKANAAVTAEAEPADIVCDTPQTESEKRLIEERMMARAAIAARREAAMQKASEASLTIETAEKLLCSLCEKGRTKTLANIYAFLSGVSRRSGREFDVNKCITTTQTEAMIYVQK